MKVTILGGTGYTGIELIRLFINHRYIEDIQVFTNTMDGIYLEDIYQNFAGSKIKIYKLNDLHKITGQYVFCALPHGISIDIVPKLLEMGKKVVDLSGDFRYKDVEIYNCWYNTKHNYPELLKVSVYGLSEYYREKIKSADLIANPGCYPTATILALNPLLKERLIDIGSIYIDGKSGVSGAGRTVKQELHFSEVDGNFKAYGLVNHRHTSEIEQELSLGSNQDVKVSFTPHLIPVKRGMLITSYGKLTEDITDDDIYNIFHQQYGNEPFVHISKGIPEVKDVVGSNSCHIGFRVDRRLGRIIVVSAIDNLLKGASGQAVQNFNIMAGLPESTGLSKYGWYL